MNQAQRRKYFTDLWPAACAANGWDVRDNARRREVTLYATNSSTTTCLQEYQITALFLYLRHLAAPDDLTLAAEWLQCRENPRAYNKIKQGKFWERKAYGGVGTTATGSSRLHRQRFKGAVPAHGFDRPATEDTADDYLLTARKRYQRRAVDADLDNGEDVPVEPRIKFAEPVAVGDDENPF